MQLHVGSEGSGNEFGLKRAVTTKVVFWKRLYKQSGNDAYKILFVCGAFYKIARNNKSRVSGLP